MAYKGTFTPKNRSKYVGNCDNIIYRSLWELKFMKYLDDHPDIVQWSSEELFVPYLSPKDNRIHRYFVDFVITMIDKSGTKQTIMIEIKPKAQTCRPTVGKRPSKSKINEVVTYAVNQAKWNAAENFCKQKGWKFQIMTEDHLGIKY